MKKMKLGIAAFASVAVLGATGLSTSVSAAEYETNGVVEFTANTDITKPIDPDNPDPNNPVDPIDPTNPEGKPNVGTAGPLSIDFASSLDFGKNKISGKDETYYANPQTYGESVKPTANYVQVSDKRGTNAGWTLKVSQTGQLKNDATQNKELTGAQIKITSVEAVSNAVDVEKPVTQDIKLDPNGAESLVMSANEGTGAGTWVGRFGSLEDAEIDGETVKKNKAVTLTIPGKTAKDAVAYTTKLNWTLSDTPGNN
ncbi:WxL domain-containing protein [Bacillus cereus]|uniref:WxL domain-containing protein n=1 Tax=Bacillus cereus TaxID=1396 RepID=UPI001E453C34|nr:WxL domain-containing protein [Bacillus cereus]MCC2454346.1 WxL domain-containing protein [Bacillus cereus]MCU5079050.1 WxL domain-containing protein [Bacillus cereus]